MKKPTDNPYVPFERFEGMIPDGHPANEDRQLTMLQSFALPVLLWFFDQNRARATGRSYLAAHLCIQLALRGNKVLIEDFSRAATPARYLHREKRMFQDLLASVMHKDYPRHVFHMDNEALTFVGIRPR